MQNVIGIILAMCFCLGIARANQGMDDMVYIPAGEFVKGITQQQAARLAQKYGLHESLFGMEVPQKKVHVDAFYIDRFEVTNRQYKAFLDVTGHPAPAHWKNGTYPQGADELPVTGPARWDAQAYATWAGKRLPTDAEWEKAARGTDGRLYPWGNEWIDGACRMDKATHAGDSFGPVPVGSYPLDVSPYGVMDMAGNVSEWVSDPGTGGGLGEGGVIKGGNFTFSLPVNCRCSRMTAQPTLNGHVGYIGFRCAKDAPERPCTGGGTLAGAALDKYLKKPMQIFPRANVHVELRAPYLPNDHFLLFVLEGGVQQKSGEPFWQGGSAWQFSEDHTVARNSHIEPEGTPGRLALELELLGKLDHMELTYKIRNVGKQQRTLTVSSCYGLHESPTFRDHEGVRTLVLKEQGFVQITHLPHRIDHRIPAQTFATSEMKAPFFVTVSRDGEWVTAETSAQADDLFQNCEYSCTHSVPRVTFEPGQEKTITQRIYVLRGTPKDLLARWRKDFNIGN